MKYRLNREEFTNGCCFDHLTAGMYVINVVDALGCSVSTVVIVKEPEPVGATMTLMDANIVDY